MQIGRTADWETDVFAAWRRSADGDDSPNSDVWNTLPSGVCWFNCRIDPEDIEKIYAIGSFDWKEVFGCYDLRNIAATSCDKEDDSFRHKSRINGIKNAMAVGRNFEPIILTAFSGEGPFVIIEGNHRAAAMMQLGILAGQPVFVGFSKKIGSEFNWFRRAVLNTD